MSQEKKCFLLIGPPGAGKSTIGGVLARRLGLPFLDTDQLIEEETGRKISEIFIEDGETTFREIEEEVVLKVITQFKGIVALGGGSILSPKVQKTIEESDDSLHVFFLDVSISNAAPRVGFNKERPLLMINPRAQWQELMNKRRPIYIAMADDVIDTNNLSPDQIVDHIVERMVA